MSIPDAPWVGLCREDYYGCNEDEEETVYCSCCGEEFCEDELTRIDGFFYCDECLKEYEAEEEGDEELHG